MDTAGYDIVFYSTLPPSTVLRLFFDGLFARWKDLKMNWDEIYQGLDDPALDEEASEFFLIRPIAGLRRKQLLGLIDIEDGDEYLMAFASKIDRLDLRVKIKEAFGDLSDGLARQERDAPAFVYAEGGYRYTLATPRHPDRCPVSHFLHDCFREAARGEDASFIEYPAGKKRKPGKRKAKKKDKKPGKKKPR